jgi:hypothetical protein
MHLDGTRQALAVDLDDDEIAALRTANHPGVAEPQADGREQPEVHDREDAETSEDSAHVLNMTSDRRARNTETRRSELS